MCVSGDAAELHDHAGGSSGPAVGYCGGTREARTRGGEECPHPAICRKQEVSPCTLYFLVVSFPLLCYFIAFIFL